MSDLTDFLLARLAEDEAAAKAVPPLGHNFDMGGNRQDERWIFDRTLPSSADGMGNWSEHRHSPTTAAHFSRHDPVRVLADVEAKRLIAEIHRPSAAESGFLPYCEGCWEDGGMDGAPTYPCRTLRALALPYADHPDYREGWKP